MNNLTNATTGAANNSRSLPLDDRQRFIHYQLGLSHDPFLHCVAELELAQEADQFFVYYVDAGSNQAVNALKLLTRTHHTIVFAPSGGGKTTLRLNLVRRLHRHAADILPVVCELNSIAALSASGAQEMINRELAKDLLIALLDRFDPFAAPAIEPGSPLACVLADLLAEPTYARLLERMIDSADGQPLDTFWMELGRTGLPPAAWVSPGLRAFGRALLALSGCAQAGKGQADLHAAVRAAGFVHVFLLVDGIDATARTPVEMARMLESVVAAVLAHPVRFLLKIFAPLELAPLLSAPVDATPAPNLRSALAAAAPLDTVTLTWTPERLAAALRQRLYAAGSDPGAALALFDPQDAERIQVELWQAADGSPRKLYRLLSRTIHAHVRARSTQPALTYEDWQEGRLAAEFS